MNVRRENQAWRIFFKQVIKKAIWRKSAVKLADNALHKKRASEKTNKTRPSKIKKLPVPVAFIFSFSSSRPSIKKRKYKCYWDRKFIFSFSSSRPSIKKRK